MMGGGGWPPPPPSLFFKKGITPPPTCRGRWGYPLPPLWPGPARCHAEKNVHSQAPSVGGSLGTTLCFPYRTSRHSISGGGGVPPTPLPLFPQSGGHPPPILCRAGGMGGQNGTVVLMNEPGGSNILPGQSREYIPPPRQRSVRNQISMARSTMKKRRCVRPARQPGPDFADLPARGRHRAGGPESGKDRSGRAGR